jgi:hypothetical protein
VHNVLLDNHQESFSAKDVVHACMVNLGVIEMPFTNIKWFVMAVFVWTSVVQAFNVLKNLL